MCGSNRSLSGDLTSKGHSGYARDVRVESGISTVSSSDWSRKDPLARDRGDGEGRRGS